MYSYFIKIALCTQKTNTLCLSIYLLENNQVQQFVKVIISSTSHMHIRNFSRPDIYGCSRIYSFLKF